MRKSLLYRRRHGRMEPGFNLTPMLDMIFYLLFFFIMATKMRDDAELGLDVRLPQARSAQEVQVEATPTLTLTAEGSIYYNNRLTNQSELEMQLRGQVGKGQYNIVIRGDERASLGRAVELLDWCRTIGMKGAILDTRPAESGPKPAGE